MKTKYIIPIVLLALQALMPKVAFCQEDTFGSINLLKTAEKVEGSENTYKLSLTSFVSGSPIFKEIGTPVDVFLVLDVSSSMAASTGDTYLLKNFCQLTTGNNIRFLHTGNEPVIDNEGKPAYYRNYAYVKNSKLRYRIGLDGVPESEGRNLAYFNGGWYYSSTSSKTDTTKIADWTEYVPSIHDIIYTDVKVDLLEEALRVFLMQISDNALEKDLDHRVGYACFSKNLGGSSALLPVNDSYQVLLSAFSDLNSEIRQGTSPVKGFTEAGVRFNELHARLRAEGKSDAEINERSKVVVMFTDGDPVNDSEDAVIASSKVFKDMDAYVYTVGIFNEGNTTQNGRSISEYMTYVSSDYPEATSFNNHGDRNTDGIEYFQESDGSNLSTIFKTIAAAAGSTAYKLTAEDASVIDVMTEDFELPVGFNASSVTTKMYVCTGEDASSPDGYTWVEYTGTEPNIYHGDDPQVQIVPVPGANDRVKVTGFYFSKEDEIKAGTGTVVKTYGNWVGKHSDGQYAGKKLVIEFDVVVKNSSLGGFNLLTNKAESGIYIGENIIKPYPRPGVDIPSIAIVKQGLKPGESAIFNVQRSGSDRVYQVVVTETGDGSPSIFVIKNLEPGEYTVSETSWSWAYEPQAPITRTLTAVPSIPGGMTMAAYKRLLLSAQDDKNYGSRPDDLYYCFGDALHLLFKFVNEPKENTPLHGENVKKNKFGEGNFKAEDGVEGEEKTL